MPGCSTGEEAYSLAIVFKEALEQLKPAKNFSLQIFATDLDGDAIDKARRAIFPHNIAADVSPARLNQFFIQDEHGYRVKKDIREMVIFAPQNLIMDPPFTKLDILSCRNLLIYLAPELQKKLIPLFHFSLNPGGVLFLGNSETIGEFTDLFAPLDDKARLFRRTELHSRAKQVEFLLRFYPCCVPRNRRRRRSQRSIFSRWQISCFCRSIPRRPFWLTTRATFSTSVGGRANTWSRPPAKPTGTSSPWPAKACAMN